jgi:hypothetical protein
MSIDTLHHLFAVPKELGDHLEEYATLDHPSRSSVPKCVWCDGGQFRATCSGAETLLDGEDIPPAIFYHKERSRGLCPP